MAVGTLLFVLAALAGAAHGAPEYLLEPAPELIVPAEGAARVGSRSPRAAASDAWLQLIADYVRTRGDYPPLFGAANMVPLLVVPVPVPVPARAACSGPDCATKTTAHTSPELGKTRSHPLYDPAKRPEWERPSDADAVPIVPATSTNTATAAPVPQQHNKNDLPFMVPAGTSKQLVEFFRTQTPSNPQLPPMLLPDEAPTSPPAPPAPPAPLATFTAASPLPAIPQPARQPVRVQRRKLQKRDDGIEIPPFLAAGPTRPRFDKSLTFRGELTVPRADYTESYVVWWNASTGDARVDYFSGGTSSYRTWAADGSVRRAHVQVDRTGEQYVTRCTVMESQRVTAADRAPPALPNLGLFSFFEYAESSVGRVERWRHTVSGHSGELGGARGEALTFRHLLEIKRTAEGHAIPIKYSVSVDSSVLGANCDGYEHRYSAVQFGHLEEGLFKVNLGQVCEATETTDRIERVEPLREFTLPSRDPRYDYEFERYQRQYRRNYSDDTEQAVRKTLLVLNQRFVDAGNRMGSTVLLTNNYLSDRLDVELNLLRGVDTSDAPDEPPLAPPAPLPARSRRSAERLPRTFDWRDYGAVSEVGNQGSCRSCWAFAVTGAVEGALFLRSGRLTPLSQQQLVDCAHPFGGHGCRGTWPRAAYEYVQNEGLIAKNSYLPYLMTQTTSCLDDKFLPATYISGHVNLTEHSVRALKEAVYLHGPTVVIVDTNPKSFISMGNGIYRDQRCAMVLKELDHAVLVVGWGEENDIPYFIVKNSWATQWGDKGFFKLSAEGNTCGVLVQPSYPILKEEDVVEPLPTNPTNAN